MKETTVLGAALAAGKAVGVWPNLDELPSSNNVIVFKPSINHDGNITCGCGKYVCSSHFQIVILVTIDGKKQ